MLKGEAQNWWEVMRRMMNAQLGGVPITWQQFVEIYNNQYFSHIYHTQKEQDFITLKQGRMLVVEYEEQFIALSQFAPELVCTEDAKCKQFEQGLDLLIRSHVPVFEITRYTELLNKSKIMEHVGRKFLGKREQFKKRRFDSGAGTLQQRSLEMTTTVEQSRAHISARGERSNNSRGVGSSRGKGSWRPLVGPITARSGNIGGIICFRCGVKGHVIRDCVMPWADKCYQCRQPGHIARHCTQGPITTSSVGSTVGGSKGATGSAWQGQATTLKLCA
ncbi:uncharacterized protein LOC130768978 [Actinidia eriantha]|uniref:uncharacterized protein LOC130768978 n=1 Tax=Actinidia eriantha TaxID=165200 RepID=UPI00258BACDD|nr:uncharacterized protein LOC130768978 [Actinidia eriantha]